MECTDPPSCRRITRLRAGQAAHGPAWSPRRASALLLLQFRYSSFGLGQNRNHRPCTTKPNRRFSGLAKPTSLQHDTLMHHISVHTFPPAMLTAAKLIALAAASLLLAGGGRLPLLQPFLPQLWSSRSCCRRLCGYCRFRRTCGWRRRPGAWQPRSWRPRHRCRCRWRQRRSPRSRWWRPHRPA